MSREKIFVTKKSARAVLEEIAASFDAEAAKHEAGVKSATATRMSSYYDEARAKQARAAAVYVRIVKDTKYPKYKED